MNSSPIRNLVSRHLCSCRPTSSSRVAPNYASLRQFSNGLSLREPASSTFNTCSPDALKRRYQPTPASVRLNQSERSQTFKRMRYSALGIFVCSLCMLGTLYAYSDQLPDQSKGKQKKRLLNSSNETSFDGPPMIAGVTPDTSTKDDVEQVPTGTSTIPTFPKTIQLSSPSDPTAPSTVSIDSQEYQLIGLGIRTVSFLSIQVYVVGLYIALSDIARLQESLIRTVDPVATTLVAGEKTKLKDMLLDPEQSEEIWNEILQDSKIRTALRIVPTRNTDFMHLRDGWVRGITSKTQHFAGKKQDQSFSDESFGLALNEFKGIWGGGARKNVPKGETLLLTRDEKGSMQAWYEDKKNGSLLLGGIADERVSRLIWLGYLGGKAVSSEGARESIVQGCMEYVGRPVGTVATQVV